jgi:pimeloyl-ACP methyl ester carboxylesterase
VYFHVQGSAGGPDIILSDGIGCIGYVWKYLEEQLRAGGWRTIRWHYRGHGRTPKPLKARRVAIADLADDLAAVLDTLEVSKAVLAGHSLGVQVCLESFRRHRDRVSALALLCGSYGNPLSTFHGRRTLEAALPLIRLVAGTAPRATRVVWRGFIPTDLAFHVAKLVEVDPEHVRKEDFFPYLEGISQVDPLLFLEMLSQAGRHSAESLLPKIDVPCLVIAGEKDGFTPVALSHSMAERIHGSELLVVQGGSHTAPIEQPELVCRTMLDFLSRRVVTPPSAGRTQSIRG